MSNNVLTKDFSKSIISNRVLITEAGKEQLRVTSVSSIQTDKNGRPYRIVNLNAITHGQLHGYVNEESGEAVKGAAELWKDGEYDLAANRNMSARAYGSSYVPATREEVHAIISLNEAGIPRISSIIPIAVRTSKKVNLDSLLAADFDADARTAELTAMKATELKTIAVALGLEVTGMKKPQVIEAIVLAENPATVPVTADDEDMPF